MPGSLLRPRVVRGVGIQGRTTVVDRVGAKFVVPRLVAVDLAQPVLGAMFREPCRRVGIPDVDRVPGNVSGGIGGGDPSCSFRFRPVLGDRLAKKLILVLGGAPATVDGELETVVRGIRRRFAQSVEQIRVEVGDAGKLVIERGHAVGEGAVSLGHDATVVAAEDSAERGCR